MSSVKHPRQLRIGNHGWRYCRYEDAYAYQNVFGPLVKLEAEYDRQMKEAQARRGITVHWETALNHRTVACFIFPKDENELRLTTGRHHDIACICKWHPSSVMWQLPAILLDAPGTHSVEYQHSNSNSRSVSE